MYIQGVISKNDRFQTIGFHSSSSLNQFNSSNNQYVPLWWGKQVCAEAKTNHISLVSPDLNTIESSCWMSSGDASRIVQCNLGIFDNFRLLSIKNGCAIKNGCGFPRTLCGITCLKLVRPRYEAVIAAGEGHVRFWTNLNSSELI